MSTVSDFATPEALRGLAESDSNRDLDAALGLSDLRYGVALQVLALLDDHASVFHKMEDEHIKDMPSGWILRLPIGTTIISESEKFSLGDLLRGLRVDDGNEAVMILLTDIDTDFPADPHVCFILISFFPSKRHAMPSPHSLFP